MRILDINQSKNYKRLLHAAITFFVLTLFLYIFNLIYTSFSFGEYSVYMQRMFLIPLFGGLIPSIILLAAKQENLVTRVSFNLWNSGLACFIFGCLVKGIVNISGRFTSKDIPYWYAGAAFLVATVFFSVCINTKKHTNGQEKV